MSVLTLLFPHRCAGCGKLFTTLCSDCSQCIDFLYFPLEKLQKYTGSNSLQAVSFYEFPIKNLIIDMKYRQIIDCCHKAAQIIHQNLKIPKIDIVSSAPSHQKRLKTRGFNQAEVIAKKLSRIINKPFEKVLIKNVHKVRQAKLSREDRYHNIDNSILAVNHKNIEGKNILLVDDVITTGSTLKACTMQLQKANAKSVHIVVLAHE